MIYKRLSKFGKHTGIEVDFDVMHRAYLSTKDAAKARTNSISLLETILSGTGVQGIPKFAASSMRQVMLNHQILEYAIFAETDVAVAKAN